MSTDFDKPAPTEPRAIPHVSNKWTAIVAVVTALAGTGLFNGIAEFMRGDYVEHAEYVEFQHQHALEHLEMKRDIEDLEEDIDEVDDKLKLILDTVEAIKYGEHQQ